LQKSRVFCVYGRQTGTRECLQTADRSAPGRLLHARNEAHEQPIINRRIARAHLAAGDADLSVDTWETEEGLPENSANAMAQTPDGSYQGCDARVRRSRFFRLVTDFNGRWACIL